MQRRWPVTSGLIFRATCLCVVWWYMILCAIWYHFYNLENVKNTHGGVLLWVLKVTLLHRWFSRFLNCTNGTKSHKASHLYVFFMAWVFLLYGLLILFLLFYFHNYLSPYFLSMIFLCFPVFKVFDTSLWLVWYFKPNSSIFIILITFEFVIIIFLGGGVKGGLHYIANEKICPDIWKLPAFWNAKVSPEDERCFKQCGPLQAAYFHGKSNSS